ncbi:hypothetical protein [Mastigocladopsis repens]|uniref:hypothetical protein n=1 Tax=Mastigocladopsis repens TaxID=221287 RepID=UPI0002F9FFAA|nr:hypothetical protein [Mastigocladopsis repens]
MLQKPNFIPSIAGIVEALRYIIENGISGGTGSTSGANSKKFPQETLSAPGATSALDVFTVPYSRINYQFDVAGISGNLFVRIEGSNTGTGWANLSPNEEDVLITTNGSYMISVSEIILSRIRFNFISGTATITVNVVASL